MLLVLGVDDADELGLGGACRKRRYETSTHRQRMKHGPQCLQLRMGVVGCLGARPAVRRTRWHVVDVVIELRENHEEVIGGCVFKDAGAADFCFFPPLRTLHAAVEEHEAFAEVTVCAGVWDVDVADLRQFGIRIPECEISLPERPQIPILTVQRRPRHHGIEGIR